MEAVAIKLSEKDYSLNQEHSRFWNEIACHKYLFERQALELETLRSITIHEFKEHFERVFVSPSSKRLDFELNSAKHIEKQAEWKAKNKDTHYKGGRIEVKEPLEAFKKKMALHPDLFKANFASFKM